ncbi:unnamed protein product, partial [Laminaria digitata]
MYTAGVAAMLTFAGAANAGDIFTYSSSLNDNSAMISAFADNMGVATNQVVVNQGQSLSGSNLGFSSMLPSSTALNGGFTMSVAAGTTSTPDTGNFYLANTNLGQSGGLRNIDFNGGDESAPAGNPIALAFGNQLWSANSLTLSFDPNVTAFGFNYEDVGDVGATLLVTFNSGESSTLSINDDSQRRDGDGFISIVHAAGIASIELVQQN